MYLANQSLSHTLFWERECVTTNIINCTKDVVHAVISFCGRTYQTEAAMWGDTFYSATITLVPPVTLVLHGLLPLHPLHSIHVLLHNIYDKCHYHSRQ